MGLCERGKEAGLMLSWREPTEAPHPHPGCARSCFVLGRRFWAAVLLR